jgi:hypothetical protein
MMFPHAGFGMPEHLMPSKEAQTLRNMVDESGIDLYHLLENIFIYFYDHGKAKGIPTVFDKRVRLELDIGGGAANRLDVGGHRMEELVGVFNTIRHEWGLLLSSKLTGAAPIERPAAAVPTWFMQYMKEDAQLHLARYKAQLRRGPQSGRVPDINMKHDS